MGHVGHLHLFTGTNVNLTCVVHSLSKTRRKGKRSPLFLGFHELYPPCCDRHGHVRNTDWQQREQKFAVGEPRDRSRSLRNAPAAPIPSKQPALRILLPLDHQNDRQYGASQGSQGKEGKGTQTT